jgi:hypothetical protein
MYRVCDRKMVRLPRSLVIAMPRNCWIGPRTRQSYALVTCDTTSPTPLTFPTDEEARVGDARVEAAVGEPRVDLVVPYLGRLAQTVQRLDQAAADHRVAVVEERRLLDPDVLLEPAVQERVADVEHAAHRRVLGDGCIQLIVFDAQSIPGRCLKPWQTSLAL